MNARCKAPAHAQNVVTDYSWLTNRRAGSAPINPAGLSPMPLQGDSGEGGKRCRTEDLMKVWTRALFEIPSIVGGLKSVKSCLTSTQ